MDLLDRAQMSAVWEILPVRHRVDLARVAAPRWCESFPTQYQLEIAASRPWLKMPKPIRGYITFYLNARATLLERAAGTK